MNLAAAFTELHLGLRYLATNVTAEKMQELRRTLDHALGAYKNGERVNGAHLLQDFEKIAFCTE
ncbi:hypothetical protein RugamoR57_09790 [Duganella caerulea]